MSVVEAVGYVGSAGAASMWVPQAVRALRHRAAGDELSGLSLGGYSVAIAFNALLIAYAVLSHAAPVLVAGCVNLVCAAVIVVTLTRPRPRPAPEAEG